METHACSKIVEPSQHSEGMLKRIAGPGRHQTRSALIGFNGLLAQQKRKLGRQKWIVGSRNTCYANGFGPPA
eukprot:1315360-Pyramimonas_sp.AAC.1